MPEAIISVKEISALAGSGTALYPISFELPAGRKLAVAGETGSGKSTLLKSIAGLQNLAGGQVLLNGRRVEEPWEKLIPGHPSIAYLSQHFELRNNYRVGDILSYAEKVSEAAAAEIYRHCQIDHLLSRKTDQLSGGERQRIAMARLLVGAPSVFLLDEPFSNLDALHKQTMKTVMAVLGRTMQITWILVSHDPVDWLSWADELLILRAGRRIMQGFPHELFYHPADEYTAGLLGPYSVIDPYNWELLGGKKEQQPNIIRPAQLKIDVTATAPLTGKVLEAEFVGYGFLLETVLDNGNRIKIFHQEAPEPGTRVGIQLR